MSNLSAELKAFFSLSTLCLQKEGSHEGRKVSPAEILNSMFYGAFNYHREEQRREQEEADRRGYEEGEELRREQERRRWLDGLDELDTSCHCCCIFL